MHLPNAFKRTFRPSQHSPARFGLWVSLYTAAVIALFLLPEATLIWVMLASLGAITGGAPADPSRAIKPRTFIAIIALTATLVIAVGLAVWLPRPGASEPAPRVVPLWLRLLAAGAWGIALVREFSHFLSIRRRAAAA